VLLLTRADLEGLLDMPTAIKLTEQLLLEQADGKVRPHEPLALLTGTGELRVNLGALAEQHIAAVRAATGGAGASLLFDTKENKLLAIMAYPGSFLRIGATVGLAVDRMARPDARRLAIIGTGTVARSCIEGIAQRRSFERVHVYSRDAGHRAEFCALAQGFGVEAEPVDEPERPIREADVVVIATLAREPVLHGAWLAEGVHVTTAGIRHEIDDETYLQADLVAVTSKDHEQRYRSNRSQDNVLVRLAREGKLPWEQVHELAEVIAGRVTPHGRTVFRESQGGYGDVPLLHWLYQRAVELGRGQPWEIGEA
jgi:ornithine cyclodeaminase/alanine dehydrogenase-like protein (mu-crystallin family)